MIAPAVLTPRPYTSVALLVVGVPPTNTTLLKLNRLKKSAVMSRCIDSRGSLNFLATRISTLRVRRSRKELRKNVTPGAWNGRSEKELLSELPSAKIPPTGMIVPQGGGVDAVHLVIVS